MIIIILLFTLKWLSENVPPTTVTCIRVVATYLFESTVCPDCPGRDTAAVPLLCRRRPLKQIFIRIFVSQYVRRSHSVQSSSTPESKQHHWVVIRGSEHDTTDTDSPQFPCQKFLLLRNGNKRRTSASTTTPAKWLCHNVRRATNRNETIFAAFTSRRMAQMRRAQQQQKKNRRKLSCDCLPDYSAGVWRNDVEITEFYPKS